MQNIEVRLDKLEKKAEPFPEVILWEEYLGYTLEQSIENYKKLHNIKELKTDPIVIKVTDKF